MISYKKAISLIKKNSITLTSKKISIKKALYKICAKDILSPSKYPSFDNSAFDGFALVSRETKGLNSKKTKKFRILKTIAAGDNPKINKYQKNSTAEIMTGALLPKQFDTIIPVEKVKYFPSKKKPTHIILDRNLKKFEYVRFGGEDYKKGNLVIKKGEQIQANHLIALATLGINEILVKKVPKIIFFGTGNEIIDYKRKNIPLWKIRNSNNLYFSAFSKELNLDVIDGGVIKDKEPNKLKQALKKTIRSDIDLFVTSGAISAGKFDFIPKFIKKIGFQNKFKGAKIKPGRPIMLSKFKKKLFFGLPGNPISMVVGFRFFIYPLIRNMLGMNREKTFKAKLLSKYSKRKDFTHFLRCSLVITKKGSCELKILKGQQSNKVKALTEANCWGIFESGKGKFKVGDFVECLPLIPSS
jgi:molybdopterin molybdotransferase